VTGIVEFVRDITDRLEAERELKEAKDEQQLLLDNIDVQVWLLEDERTYRRVNDAFAEFVGMDKKDILNSEVYEVRKVRRSQQRCLQGNKKVFAEKEEIKREEKVLNSSGEERVLLITKTPILSDSGEVEYVICTGKDITELKKTQENLKVREEQYRKIFETAPVGIILEDSEGNILEVNESTCEITGYSEEELVGSNVVKTVTPPEYREEAKENIEKIIAGEDVNYTGIGHRKNGDEYHVSLNETRVTLPSGEKGILSTQLDITELKEKEEKLKYLGYHDSLTDLYNRTFMEAEMERLNTERQYPISLIYCDINGLKIVNDTYGHEVGDELLIKTAEILQKVTRDEDLVARWAGDEFVILLPQTDRETAEEVIERIESACKGAEFKDIPINLGIGSAVKKKEETSYETVFNRADERMYKDKLTKSRSAENKLVKNMLATLEAKSAETREHSMRMTELAHKLGNEAGLNSEQVNDL
ncbi:PAS domain S-box-containing protein/diguanylate cyclase (GGDEF) domain-containing protein, partial [Halarsenatibacter silvermanii]